MSKAEITPSSSLQWRSLDRPKLTQSTLPLDLIDAIAKTAYNGRCVEFNFQGDPLGSRRFMQRLAGLSKRGRFPSKAHTAKRAGCLYVWLDPIKRLRRPKANRVAHGVLTLDTLSNPDPLPAGRVLPGAYPPVEGEEVDLSLPDTVTDPAEQGVEVGPLPTDEVGPEHPVEPATQYEL